MGFGIVLPGITSILSLVGFIDDNLELSPMAFVIFGLLFLTALFITLTKDVSKKNKRIIFFAIIIFTVLYPIADFFIPVVIKF